MHSTRPAQKKVALVVSRFNELITKELLAGSLDTFQMNGFEKDLLQIFWTPGAFEIPLVAQELAKTGQYSAILCLGAVIKGETDHYHYVCSEVTKGVAKVGLNYSLPCIFGVLTTHTLQEALDRVGGKSGHKGRECALATIQMIKLLESIQTQKSEL